MKKEVISGGVGYVGNATVGNTEVTATTPLRVAGGREDDLNAFIIDDPEVFDSQDTEIICSPPPDLAKQNLDAVAQTANSSLQLLEEPPAYNYTASSRTIEALDHNGYLGDIPRQRDIHFDLSQPLRGLRQPEYDNLRLPNEQNRLPEASRNYGNQRLPNQRSEGYKSLQEGDDFFDFIQSQNHEADLGVFPGYENRDAQGYLDDNHVDHRRFNDALDILKKSKCEFSSHLTDDPEEFLNRLLEVYHIINLNNLEFLNCIPFALDGVALHWFRLNKHRWATFWDFALAWRERFIDLDFQFNLYNEIRQRTQHPEERVADYLTAMKCLLDKVDPAISEAKKIETATRNMVPILATRLPFIAITTWTQLERESVKLERAYLNSKNFKKPPKPEDSMFPNLAFREPPSSSFFEKSMANLLIDGQESDLEEDFLDQEVLILSKKKTKKLALAEPNKQKNDSSVLPGKAKELCFNCGVKGHYARDCSNPSRVFCRVCGKIGVYKSTCPNCKFGKPFCTLCGLVGYSSSNCPHCTD